MFSTVKSLVVGAAFVLGATSAFAGTVTDATFVSQGSFGAFVNFDEEDGWSTYAYASGEFAGELFTDDLSTAKDYTLTASLLVGGVEQIVAPFNALSLFTSIDDAVDFVEGLVSSEPILTYIWDYVVANPGVSIPLLGADFYFATDSVVITDSSISGDFDTYLQFFSDDGQTFGYGNDYELTLTLTSIAAVPLPASLPLLGFAMAGLWGVRRKKQNA